MITAVATNILLDLLIPDAPEGETSQRLLEIALQQGNRCLFHKYTASSRRDAVGAQHAAPLLPGAMHWRRTDEMNS